MKLAPEHKSSDDSDSKQLVICFKCMNKKQSTKETKEGIMILKKTIAYAHCKTFMIFDITEAYDSICYTLAYAHQIFKAFLGFISLFFKQTF